MNLTFSFASESRQRTSEKVSSGFNFDRSDGHDEWLTPPELVRALGDFDLDPCAPVVPPWKNAELQYSKFDNGLMQEWKGRVWMNPPYGDETPKWLEKLAQHGNGIALIFARTETSYFFDWIWDEATALLFLRGRLSFYTVEGRKVGTAGAPSVLIAYGNSNAAALLKSKIPGHYVHLR